jgi:multiple sugar transport system permease protein
LFGLASAAYWLAQVISANRRRSLKEGVALTVALVATIVAGQWLWRAGAPGVAASELLLIVFTTLSVILLKGVDSSALWPHREINVGFLQVVLASTSLLFLIPLLWMLITSVKSDDQMGKFPPEIIPRQQLTTLYQGREVGEVTLLSHGRHVLGFDTADLPNGDMRVALQDGSASTVVVPATSTDKVRHFSPRWRNYVEALQFLPPETRYGLVFLANTLIIAILSVFGTVLSCSLVAYSFARLRWPGRDFMFGILLATMMLPAAVTMMPTFLIFRSLGWVDTLLPLWAPSFFGSAFSVFLLRQFFMGVPRELEEAARIDGCGYISTYWRIMLPQVRPALAAVSIMTFMGAWNNYMGPLIYVSSPLKMPLAYALQLFQSSYGGEPGMLMAAAALVVTPVILLFFFTQKYFVEGISLTGMGGR